MKYWNCTGDRATAFAAALALLALPAAQAQADDYPSRPITFVSPLAAGGSGDGLCRMVSSSLEKKLGQPVIHESRPGANVEIALVHVAKAKADGYTLPCAPSPMVINPHFFKDTKYDPFQDFDPVGLAASYNYVLFVHSSVPAKNVGEFITVARSQPGKLTYGSSGVGGGSHLGFEMMANMAKFQMLRVPYKASAQVAVDLMTGRLSAGLDAASTIEAMTAGGRVRAIGSVFPIAAHPHVPLISDTLPGFSVDAWVGVAVPKGTPATRVAKLSRALNDVLRDPAYVNQLTQGAMIPASPSTPAEFDQYMKSEFDRYGKLVRENGIQPER